MLVSLPIKTVSVKTYSVRNHLSLVNLSKCLCFLRYIYSNSACYGSRSCDLHGRGPREGGVTESMVPYETFGATSGVRTHFSSKEGTRTGEYRNLNP